MSAIPVDSFEQIGAAPGLAVIVNCNTKWVTTLALASAIRHANRPVVLIDCESRDGSIAHFMDLARSQRWEFYLLRWPLRPHGLTLDRVFREITSETVLLIDSDLEIQDPAMLHSMTRMLANDPAAYGCGPLNDADWMGPPLHLLPPGTGYYAERMWIPFTLLRADAVRQALAQGDTFAASREYLEIAGRPRLSQWLYRRFRIPLLRKIPARRSPAFIELDTGASLHRSLVAKGKRYLQSDRWSGVHHYHGVTRARLGGNVLSLVRRLKFVEPTDTPNADTDAIARLRAHYNIDFETTKAVSRVPG